MSGARDMTVRVLAGLLLMAAVLAGQAVTDSRTPTGLVSGTGATVGRAAFSYLSGLRAFAAYELWNRLEPQLHGYYSNEQLKDQLFSVPTMRIVMLLKPDFDQPYYILPWMLAENGKPADAKAVALEGVTNNPGSGLLLVSYAQLLAIKFDDWTAAAPFALRAMRTDTYWADDTQKWQSLRVAEDIFAHVGDAANARAAAAVLDAIAAKTGGAPPADAFGANHDHNGDGVADH